MSARALLASAVLTVALVAAAGAAGAAGARGQRGRSGAAQPARDAALAPTVQSMIVGSGGQILAPAWTVTASATTLHIGARSCAVAAGTPLAVLAADRRAGGPGFAVRDYGHCDAAAANSGQLFVYSVGGESNHGQSGWEYKAEGASGTTGAADPSGPQGDGRRLRSGERVLWFWCEASARGCQRTLGVSPSSATVSPGGTLGVTVSGYDNEGRSAPVAGAIVTLGSDFASSGLHGHATLLAPSRPGRYQLSAVRRGLVPSFPGTIVVR